MAGVFSVDGLPDDFQPFNSDGAQPDGQGQGQTSLHPLGGYAVQGVNDGYAEGGQVEGGFGENGYGEGGYGDGSYGGGGYANEGYNGQIAASSDDAYATTKAPEGYSNENGYYPPGYSYPQQQYEEHPSYGYDQSQPNGDQPSYGYDQSQSNANQPSYGYEQTQPNGELQPSYGYDQPQSDIIYKQDASAGDDGAVTSSAPIPTPSHLPTTTVSSGVGPTYVPDDSADVGGTYIAVPVSTKLFASYTWTVHGFHQITDEKLVSPPFGPADWRWQLVLYPKGAGNGEGTHVSGFLRPLRSEAEIAAGDEWVRPMKEFSFRVRRAVPGSPVIAGVGAPPDVTDDYLVMDTSDPAAFNGFSATRTGWGFPELLDLNSLSEAVTYDGTLTIEADVVGDQTVDWAMYQYQWEIPSFLQLTEDETLSQPFGTSDCQWRLKIHRQGDKDGQGTHLSAYLVPERTERELALGSVWTRPIVSLTVKMWAANPSEVLVSKTLTGGYIFSEDNLTSGWSQLCELSVLNDVLDYYGTLSLQAEVVWNPAFASPGTQVGKARDSLALVNVEVPHLRRAVEALRDELDSAKGELVNVRSELSASSNERSASQQEVAILRSQLEESKGETEALRISLAESEARVKLLAKWEGKHAMAQKDLAEVRIRLEEMDKMKEQLAAAKQELQNVRNVQDAGDSLKVKLGKIKARIVSIRAGMEDDAELSQDTLAEGQENTEELDAQKLKAQLIETQAKLAQTEADLVATQVQLEQKERAMTDAAIFAPMGMDQPAETDETPTLQSALEAVRNELLVAQTVLEDTNFPPTEAERASASAEVAMVMAELDVARATLVEAVSKIPEHAQLEDLDLVAELENVRKELSSVRAQLTAARTALDDGFGAMDVTLLSSGQQTPDEKGDGGSGGGEGRMQYADSATSPLNRSFQDVGVSSMSLDRFVDDGGHGGVPPPPIIGGNLPPPPPMFGAPPKASADQDELETLRAKLADAETELSEMKHRMVAVREMVLPGAGGGGGGLSVDTALPSFDRLSEPRRSSIASTVHTFQHEVPAEPWTPVEKVGGSVAGVDGQELAKLLKAVQTPKPSLFGRIWSVVTFFTLTWLAIYSSISVVCAPNPTSPALAEYAAVCQEHILPAWNTIGSEWHLVAENLAVHVVPGAIGGVGSVARKAAVGVKKRARELKGLVQQSVGEQKSDEGREKREVGAGERQGVDSGVQEQLSSSAPPVSRGRRERSSRSSSSTSSSVPPVPTQDERSSVPPVDSQPTQSTDAPVPTEEHIEVPSPEENVHHTVSAEQHHGHYEHAHSQEQTSESPTAVPPPAAETPAQHEYTEHVDEQGKRHDEVPYEEQIVQVGQPDQQPDDWHISATNQLQDKAEEVVEVVVETVVDDHTTTATTSSSSTSTTDTPTSEQPTTVTSHIEPVNAPVPSDTESQDQLPIPSHTSSISSPPPPAPPVAPEYYTTPQPPVSSVGEKRAAAVPEPQAEVPMGVATQTGGEKEGVEGVSGVDGESGGVVGGEEGRSGGKGEGSGTSSEVFVDGGNGPSGVEVNDDSAREAGNGPEQVVSVVPVEVVESVSSASASVVATDAAAEVTPAPVVAEGTQDSGSIPEGGSYDHRRAEMAAAAAAARDGGVSDGARAEAIGEGGEGVQQEQ
ncbi:hypothetical protein HDV00_004369 [Rhizophlyctis rosea]|nr:hypothetical protein HDV00_004369 [Rhizophlyctis rosea]